MRLSILPRLTIVGVFYTLIFFTRCSRASTTDRPSSTQQKLPSSHLTNSSPSNTNDPFVSAAPLIVAAVCSEGVVLIALHTAFANEPLILDVADSSDKENTTTPFILDLPKSYRGPFRIHSIDRFGTGLVCAGWRTHGQIIVDICRKLAKEQIQEFGVAQNQRQYGQYLASETSLRMAWSAVYQKRPLSSVGLLACGINNNVRNGVSTTSIVPGGYLWLVDDTGAYRVRAFALGSGPMSSLLNQHLEQMDFLTFTAEETMKHILEWLSQQELPSQSRVELAIVGACPETGKQRLTRVFSSQLFGVKR